MGLRRQVSYEDDVNEEDYPDDYDGAYVANSGGLLSGFGLGRSSFNSNRRPTDNGFGKSNYFGIGRDNQRSRLNNRRRSDYKNIFG